MLNEYVEELNDLLNFSILSGILDFISNKEQIQDIKIAGLASFNEVLRSKRYFIFNLNAGAKDSLLAPLVTLSL